MAILTTIGTSEHLAADAGLGGVRACFSSPHVALTALPSRIGRGSSCSSTGSSRGSCSEASDNSRRSSPHVAVFGAMGSGFGVSAEVTGAAGGLAAAAAAAAQERRTSREGAGAASWSNPRSTPPKSRASSLGGSSPSQGGFSLMPTTAEPATVVASYSPPFSRQSQRAAEETATEQPQLQPQPQPQLQPQPQEDEECLSPDSSSQLLSSVSYWAGPQLAAEVQRGGGIASSLFCPITKQLMTDPVFTMDGQVTLTLTLTLTLAPTLTLTLTLAPTLILTLNRNSNQTYERAAIEAWLKTNDTSPATGKSLPSKKLVDNVRAHGMVRTAAESQAAAVTLAEKGGAVGEVAAAKEAAQTQAAAEAEVVAVAAEAVVEAVVAEAAAETEAAAAQTATARAAAVEQASDATSETDDDELRADPLPQFVVAGGAAASAAAAASAEAAEREARAQWIAYHLSVGELEEARELGWTGDEASAAVEVAAAARAAAAAEATQALEELAAAAAAAVASAVGGSVEASLTVSAEEDQDEDGEDEEEAMARLLAPSITGHVEGAYGRAIVTTGAPPPAEPPTSGSPDRAQWIAYHLSVGELAEARELGWVDDEAAAQNAWAAAEAAEAAAAAAHHRQSAVGWLAAWGEATAARLDRKMAAEGEAAEPRLVDAAVGWLANLFSPRAAVGEAATEEEEEVARRRAATAVQAVARGRVTRRSRDFGLLDLGISGARPAELEVGASPARDRNLEELRGSGSPYIQRSCSRSGSPYGSPDMPRSGNGTGSANAAVHAHLDRLAQEVSRSPAPGESTEAMVRRFSSVGSRVLTPSPPAQPAIAPTIARRELHFEGDVASVKQTVMLQAWGRVLLAKARVRTAKRDYRQQALAEHVRAKSAARIQTAYRSPDRPARPASAPPSSPLSSPLSSRQRRAEGTPLPLLPLPATEARRASLLYSASPPRPGARPKGPPSLPKPSPQRAQTLKRLMAQARLPRSS